MRFRSSQDGKIRCFYAIAMITVPGGHEEEWKRAELMRVAQDHQGLAFPIPNA